MKISATIITFNEEKNIKRCLESLEEVVNEIVIVDSFSTDKTIEICKLYTSKIYQQSFEGYGSQKNFATNKSQNDWILSIDADEVLSQELKNSISKLKENSNFDAYTFSRITNFCGKWIKYGGWYPDTQLRLWNKNNGLWNDSNVHERIQLNEHASICKIKGDLLHYSYYNLGEYLDRINKYSDLKAKDLFSKGKKANVFTLLFKPFFKFFILYFLKLGILDGFYGFVIAISTSYSTFLNYIKIKHNSSAE